MRSMVRAVAAVLVVAASTGGGFLGGRLAAQDAAGTGSGAPVTAERVEAMADYLEATTTFVSDVSELYVNAGWIAEGRTTLEESILATRIDPSSQDAFRIQIDELPSGRRFTHASAKVQMLFSDAVQDCAARLQGGVQVMLWDLDALARTGELEWYARRELQSDPTDRSGYLTLWTVMQLDLVENLTAVARAEIAGRPTDDPPNCAGQPAYFEGASTVCDAPAPELEWRAGICRDTSPEEIRSYG